MTNIDLEMEDGTLPTQKAIVDYDKLPMRCKACHSWQHRMRDCNEMQKKFVRGGMRSTHAPHSYQPDKGKNIAVGEDGFQQVQSRKNTKKNIFNIVNDEMRSSAFALEEETMATLNKSKPLEGEASRGRGG